MKKGSGRQCKSEVENGGNFPPVDQVWTVGKMPNRLKAKIAH